MTGVVAFAGFDAATGTNAPNKAGVFTPLAPFEERVKKGLSGQKILAALRAKMATIDEALVLVFPPPPVRGMGNVGGFRMMVEDRRGRGYQALEHGQALSAMAEVANRVLPDGFGLEWTALAYQQILAGNTSVFIFPLCVLFCLSHPRRIV